MFKQLEYSEILFKNLLLKFGRCARDGSLIDNDLFVPIEINLMLSVRNN